MSAKTSGAGPDVERGTTLADTWRANADLWTDAIRSGSIASRRLVTDAAIVEAVMRRRPASVLDLGCGEGWLTRALSPHVGRVVGVDASPELIARAKSAGAAAFHEASYADIVGDPTRFGDAFDVVVATFALLDDNLQPLLRALTKVVRPGGALVVQTLHPSGLPLPYEDGWRTEDFRSFGGEGSWRPMPWYFRTLGTWLTDIAQAWRIIRVEEPRHPETGVPASLLITADHRSDPYVIKPVR